MNDDRDEMEKFSDSVIFGDVPEEKLDEISRIAESRVLSPGTMIFRRGDPGDSFWIIQSGKVRVFRKYDEDVEITLSELGPGDSFGEMALLTGETRSANVETVEETRLTVLSKDQFDRVLKDYPNLSLTFIKQMSVWLRRDEKALEMGAKRDYAPPRLSWFDFILLIGVSVLFALAFNQSNPNRISLFPKMPSQGGIGVTTPEAAMAEFKGGEGLFVDAMPSNFYDQRHIKDAVNMPLSLFDIVYMMTLGEEDKARNIIVYGKTISRLYDLEVANKLVLRGYQNVKILEGGLSAWEKKGYPVEP